MRARWGVRGGFTLVEVVLSLVIVGVLVVALAQSVAQGARIESRAGRSYEAALLAAQVMGRIEAAGDPLAAGTGGDFRQQGRPEFAWRVQTASLAGGLTEVTVLVEWMGDGPARSYRLVRWLRAP